MPPPLDAPAHNEAAPHAFRLDQRLRKQERLRARPEFLAVQRRGQRATSDALVAVVLRHPSPPSPFARLGLTVSKKVGNAVVRNRIKRRLREIFRRNKPALPAGCDIVWIARPAAAQASYDALLQQALTTTARALRSGTPSRAKRPSKRRP